MTPDPTPSPEAFPDQDRLVQEHLRLVQMVARRMASRLPAHVELEDLIHFGVLGLMDAARKFQPDREVLFKTYAELRIKGAIVDGLRELDWMPRSLRRRKRDIGQARARLEQRLGHSATREELAIEMGLTGEELQKLLDDLEGPGDPLSEPGLDENAEGLAGLLPDLDTEDAHAQIENRERDEQVQRAVEALPRKERFVIQLYSFADLTMKEIGTLLNLTESRVSQLYAQAMENLRKELEDHG